MPNTMPNTMYQLHYTHHFAAAHRLLNYEGPCHNLHGHNYTVYLVFETSELNSQDMIEDFTKVKAKCAKTIDICYDHMTVLHHHDPLVGIIRAQGQQVYVLSKNPTAEAMAEDIHLMIPDAVSVTVEETEGNSATHFKEVSNA